MDRAVTGAQVVPPPPEPTPIDPEPAPLEPDVPGRPPDPVDRAARPTPTGHPGTAGGREPSARRSGR
jgi:hypothetical protein